MYPVAQVVREAVTTYLKRQKIGRKRWARSFRGSENLVVDLARIEVTRTGCHSRRGRLYRAAIRRSPQFTQ